MKILEINKFFYLKGGPERYMFGTSDVLKAKGHELAFFSMEYEDNEATEWSRYFVKKVDYDKKHGIIEKARIFKNTLYSYEAEKKLERLIDSFSPDIAHVHNFNHQLTPSILHALRRKNVPIIATLHDYKLTCPSYSMLNHGHTCELCKRGRFYHCFRTRCHKNSFSKSFLATVESYIHHYILDSYRHINCFICPSTFIMNKMSEMGLKGRFFHLPNFVDIKHLTPLGEHRKNRLVYWGRISREKGIETLIEAMKGISSELILIGDGPLRGKVETMVKNSNIGNIKILGYLSGEMLFKEIKKCAIAVIPSEWYENNPNSILEAFALGLPVIGSRIGGIPELVKHGETGLLFEPGNVQDLRDKIKELLSDPAKVEQMGKNARALAEKEYNPERHYKRLMEIYNKAVETNRQKQ